MVGARFARRSDILGAGPLQDFLRLLGPLGAVGVDGEQDPTVFDAAFVPFGFVFRDSHSNEGSRDPADRTSPSRPCPPPPPPPAPAIAATIGPAAIKGPRPGMAKAPMPASHPNPPPSTAPVPAPAEAPSGAFVPFLTAKSFDPTFSGNRTEMSVFRKPAVFRASTLLSTLP